MVKFILNNKTIESDLPAGTTVLDFVRYHENLKGTKIGCREGDCGACTILVGEINNNSIKYRSMTSCLMPLANANGKHIVTVEGINKQNNELTEVQRVMVDESGTQCGFCTVGFVMSLTGFFLDETEKSCEMAISSIDGNICRCTGYKSIERAAKRISGQWPVVSGQKNSENNLDVAIKKGIVPNYFSEIKEKLVQLKQETNRPLTTDHRPLFVGGGTDLYVQRPEELIYASAENLFDDADLKFIEETNEFIELGASVTVTDLLVSPVMQKLFPNLYKHLKLVSSTPIRNMATLAGNFVNASPIGDMTIWFLALNASIVFNNNREMPLRELYLGYKTLAKSENEFIKMIRFRKDVQHFNFEKVCKRTFLDIASVNTAISLHVSSPTVKEGFPNHDKTRAHAWATDTVIVDAHVSAGGVAPIPLYLKKTSEFLRGKEIAEKTILQACEILQYEISPISDVRGSEGYKRLLLRQLFTAHFVELFDFELGN
ncbi:MAG: FAD binding domain-containing protein [Acidobacteriota bacterium]|nr:FAD binding domain-containing protein [Acidobacteriota bacterium]